MTRVRIAAAAAGFVAVSGCALGEVEGLQVSYTGVKDKLLQIGTTMRRAPSATELGTPGFDGIAGRTSNPSKP